MKVSEVANMYSVIMGMGKKRMPIRMSRVLTRNARKMESIVKDFDEDKQKILEKYGEKNEDGTLKYTENGGVKVPDQRGFFAELNEVGSMEVEVTLEKILEQDLERCDSEPEYDTLTKEEVDVLDIMLEDEI